MENQVKVELIRPQNQTTTEELFLNGSVDGLCSIFTTTIFQNSEGVNSRLVWVLDYSGTGDVILGSKNMTVKELKGKKIGVEGLNTFSHIFVLQILAKAGLYEKDVHFANLAAQDMVKALNTKQIDAGHTYGPAKFAGIQSGYDIVATAKDVPAIIADILIFNSKVVETRPEAIDAVVKSINQGKEYFDRNKENNYFLLSNFYNMTTEEVQDGFEGITITKDGTISIKVSTDKESGEAIICIKDTGQGIDPGIVPHLFTKFSSKSFEGIGLGLFIAKNIVEAHGGRIWAENNSDGKGAVFFFTLRII